jgi:hypothetical protein
VTLAQGEVVLIKRSVLHQLAIICHSSASKHLFHRLLDAALHRNAMRVAQVFEPEVDLSVDLGTDRDSSFLFAVVCCDVTDGV